VRRDDIELVRADAGTCRAPATALISVRSPDLGASVRRSSRPAGIGAHQLDIVAPHREVDPVAYGHPASAPSRTGFRCGSLESTTNLSRPSRPCQNSTFCPPKNSAT